MSASRRILLVGGLALAAWGMAYGLWYAVFAEHQALDAIGSALTSGFSASAQRDSVGITLALARYREAKYVYDRCVDVHSHWLGLAILLIVIGLAFDGVAFSEKSKRFLAVALLLGAVLFPFGVWLQTLSHGSFPRAVAVAGSALMVLALAVTALGFARQNSAHSSF